VTNPELVTALDLDQWSSSLSARSTLPVLVRRLILATASVTEIAMRGGESTGLPGWDGLVKSAAEDPHIPTGTSAWELGTSQNPRDKAQSDYRARTAQPLGIDPATTTFVAVTSRIWRDRDDWRAARRKEDRWADVRAYDADDLETWLERAPGVHVWISELLGRDPLGVKSPDRWWSVWSSQTHPALSRSFLLAGRNTNCASLRDALEQSAQVITIDAPSKEEALAFTCAVLTDEAEQGGDLATRSLVVSETDTWDRLVDSGAGLVLIPTFEDPDVSTAINKGHRVVIPAARVVRPRGAQVTLVPLDQLKAANALMEEAGLDRPIADRRAEQARQNLLSLRRTIAISPAYKKPSWSQAPEGSRLAPLVLAGAWQQDSDGDRKAIAGMAGRPYGEVERDIAAWSSLEDAPMRRSGQTWNLVSKDDAWELIAQLITVTDLSRFQEIALQILRELDPALDLRPDRRFMTSIVGEPRIYSATLRASIADTAAFLGGYVQGERLADGLTGQDHADRLVQAVTRKLNSDTTGRGWQSLADVLPLLAEASPDHFLSSVEAGLAGNYPILRVMFLDDDSGRSFGVSSPHFSLVWALETLCWSPDHLSRAATVLARLADIDPDPQGRSHPRPAGSLASVFRLALPQTTATPKARLAVLDRLRRHKSESSWHLLLDILPAPGIGFPTHRPRWRSWAQGQDVQPNPAELSTGIAEIVSRLLGDVGSNAGRWIALTNHLPSLPVDDRDRVLASLKSLNPDTLGEQGKADLWRALMKLCARHRQFSNESWSMSGNVVRQIEEIADKFAPASLIDLNVDLFDHHPRLSGVDQRNFAAYDKQLQAARRSAVSNILDRGGVADLLELASTVKVPQAVGWAAAEARGDALAGELLSLFNREGSDYQVARGYSASRIDTEGLEWVERQIDRLGREGTPEEEAGLFLAVTRPSQRLLVLVQRSTSDVQEIFWHRMNPVLAERDAISAIASELVGRRRPWSAVNILVHSGAVLNGIDDPTDIGLVELALERAAIGPADDVMHATSMSWEVKELLDYLERAGSDSETRARLEFLLMPLLQFTRPARALESALRERPGLFVEIISTVYHAEDDPRDEEVPPERRALAEVGFTALRSWHTPPGVQSDGLINTMHLRHWIHEARRLLAEARRLAVGDLVIGEVLAYANADGDGIWPPQPVRDLIEEIASDKLETGIQTGKFNSRGLVTRDPVAGGDQERVLARQFRDWSAQVADEWPRTAVMLRGLAATYERWANREDDQADNPRESGNYARLGRLSEVAEDQWGLFTSRQAELVGVTGKTLQRLVMDGILQRVAQDVYHLGAAVPNNLDLRAAWLQLAPEVSAWERTPEQGVVSHRSAAALYDLGHLPADFYDFTVEKLRSDRRPDVRLYQGTLHEGEWIKLDGIPVTRPSRIASDLLKDEEEPEAVAYIVADAIRSKGDYPGAFVDTLGPYAIRFGLKDGDGLALLRWLLGLVGDPDTDRWIDEAKKSTAGPSSKRQLSIPPYPQVWERDL
jgi:hypothetical protein